MWQGPAGDGRAWEHHRRRWHQCDGARVDLRILVHEGGSRHKIFHQESTLVWDERLTDAPGAVVGFRVPLVIKVRPEYWNRMLRLSVRIELASVDVPPVASGGATTSATTTPAPLEEDVVATQLLPLLYESLAAAEPPARQLAADVVVTKPLDLRIDTRVVAPDRVCILARATNVDTKLSIEVLDLQFHLDQTQSRGRSGSTHKAKAGSITGANPNAAANGTDSASANGQPFRRIDDDKQHFPVVLAPSEQYNFPCTLRMVPTAADTADARQNDSRQTLMTVSWRVQLATTCSNVITEYHTIIWSPQGSSSASSAPSLPLAMPPALLAHQSLANVVVNYPDSAATAAATCTFVPLDKRANLHVQLAPSRSARDVPLGIVHTLCLLLTNRSTRESLDLTLLLPPPIGRACTWIGMEASHRIGYVVSDIAQASLNCRQLTPSFHRCQTVLNRPSVLLLGPAVLFLRTCRLVTPGVTVRKSLRVAFLRAGRCDLSSLVLFDSLSRTFFLPPAAAEARACEVLI
ncbi:TPA: hypothetical protein N0F65_005982 [Lagenidium giganteum]|uniref:Uncharacterized protein n=1 Tax=Lagenidium giganteum TaxID=4803 RepID=A0AAV2ZAM3_9STRA|nr:TPA: hypothetical protein N0F65_005982 [Lagenidium giganteum]